MNEDSIRFCQILISKICHDFSSVICAINNCAYILNEDNTGSQSQIDTQTQHLLIESTNNLVRKLAVYKHIYAYRHLENQDAYIELSEFESILKKALPKTAQLEIICDPGTIQTIKLDISKVLVLIALITSCAFYCDTNYSVLMHIKTDQYQISIANIQGKYNKTRLNLDVISDHENLVYNNAEITFLQSLIHSANLYMVQTKNEDNLCLIFKSIDNTKSQIKSDKWI